MKRVVERMHCVGRLHNDDEVDERLKRVVSDDGVTNAIVAQLGGSEYEKIIRLKGWLGGVVTNTRNWKVGVKAGYLMPCSNKQLENAKDLKRQKRCSRYLFALLCQYVYRSLNNNSLIERFGYLKCGVVEGNFILPRFAF